jgi:predicted LPLAT superfamily acyltransferase
VSNSPKQTRNPGPDWGFRFLLQIERGLPDWIFRPALMLGTWVALAAMPVERGHSRAYLSVVFGRQPRLVEVWRHFFAFTEFLIRRLRVSRGAAATCMLDPPNAAEFEALLASGRPALFGTFHFGHSDLIGFLLGAHGRHVSMIRLRVGNSDDTRLLGRRFEKWVSFLWINDPLNVIFAVKAAIEAGNSLAMKCDRLEYSAKAEPFHFLGGRRLFPFTIYRVAILFELPVVFCLGVPGRAATETRVFASPVFAPDRTATREVNLEAARAHFQGVLALLETVIRQDPTLWFNFLPLNPEVTEPVGHGNAPLGTAGTKHP